jgi:KEOPS complex subunit Cgi121
MEIVGGRTDVADVGEFVAAAGEIADEHGVVVQAFDARYVVDRHHLRRAVDLAARARERGDAIADDPGVEVLLYAAGRRQIDRALEMGVSEGPGPVAAVAVDLGAHEWVASSGADRNSGDPPATADERAAADAVADLLDDADADALDATDDERVRSFFDVSEQELAATRGDLADVVHERVALLVVER